MEKNWGEKVRDTSKQPIRTRYLGHVTGTFDCIQVIMEVSHYWTDKYINWFVCQFA